MEWNRFVKDMPSENRDIAPGALYRAYGTSASLTSSASDAAYTMVAELAEVSCAQKRQMLWKTINRG